MSFDLKISYEPILYDEALKLMEERVDNIISNTQPNLLWFLEHPNIYTAGISAKDNEITNPYALPVYNIGRGGKYTYHGPGQTICYIMMNLKIFFAPSPPDIRKFINLLESWIMESLNEIGISCEVIPDKIGIWAIDKNGNKEKIASIGIRIKKWVSYHGIAININPDLKFFNGIIPCGIKEYGITSLEKMGVMINRDQFNNILITKFIKIFNAKIN